jgi:hypothetical protein
LEQVSDTHVGLTAIGNAIHYAIGVVDRSPFIAEHIIFDVSGDGIDNDGGNLPSARASAMRRNITINGLTVLGDSNKEVDLVEYYKNEVIVGDDAFIEVANGYADYARAIVKKIRQEVSVARR